MWVCNMFLTSCSCRQLLVFGFRYCMIWSLSIWMQWFSSCTCPVLWNFFALVRLRLPRRTRAFPRLQTKYLFYCFRWSSWSCQMIGYPAMIKASWGGGGEGIRKVNYSFDLTVLKRSCGLWYSVHIYGLINICKSKLQHLIHANASNMMWMLPTWCECF
jgi:hypothetical protein